MFEPAASDPRMNSSAKTDSRAEKVAQEIDHARSKGTLREIVIPPCPDLLVQMQAAMKQREPDLTVVARIAGSDIAMSATLLRNANGPLHAGSQPVTTLGQAMNRIGLDETATLITGFLVRHAIPVKHPQLQRFWERSVLRAAAMRFIGTRLPGLSPELAHLYGLFLHVGIPVLMQSVRGYAGTLVEAQARIDRSFVATENANHRTDHAVVGALVARTWRLAPTLVAGIRLHHDLEAIGSDGTEPEVHTLVAAGLLAEHLMRRREGLDPESDWTRHQARALAWLHLTDDDLADWSEPLRAALDAV